MTKHFSMPLIKKIVPDKIFNFKHRKICIFLFFDVEIGIILMSTIKVQDKH